MALKIDFINPFGTTAYDGLIAETLTHYAAEGTELVVTHLDACPPDIDYFYAKHLMEAVLFERIMQDEEEGFDAVIVGCCYDPGVRVARELVDIPVVGPMEASLQLSGNFGHSSVIVTDHHKAAPYIDDMMRMLGYGTTCRGVRTIEWWVKDMVKDPDAVALDTIARCRDVLAEANAEVVLMGCTIIAACYQRYLMRGNAPPDVTIVNPNLMALKMAEMLAGLRQKGGHQIARQGYYEKPKGHYRDGQAAARETFRRAIAAMR
ncbi:MAG: aspartate/glutamate racemase family protein [Hyphomicrobiaceae bacterium]